MGKLAKLLIENGGEENVKRAVELIECAGKNNPSHWNNLGADLYYGTGIAKDVKKAISFFERAAEAGVSVSYFWIGWIFIDGREGNTADVQKAARAFVKAHELGYQEAKEKVKSIFNGGYFVEWESSLHPYYMCDLEQRKDVQSALKTLLLICKCRNESANKMVMKAFPKGIVLKVAKYLCELIYREFIQKNQV